MRTLNLSITTLFSCGLLTFGNINVYSQEINKEFKITNTSTLVKKKTTRNLITTATNLEPKPQKAEIYIYGDYGWGLSSIANMSYNNSLQLIEKSTAVYDNIDNSILGMMKDCYVYDDFGNMIENSTLESYDEGETWSNMMLLKCEYDNIRKDLPILKEYYLWDEMSNSWYLDEENEDGFFLEIDRDNNNRVINSITWLNSEKPIALVSHSFNYDSNNSAVGFLWNALNEDYELEPTYIYDNIKWLRTDNQFVSISPNIYYPFETDINNVLISYDLYNANYNGTKDVLEASYNSVYDSSNRLSKVEILFQDGIIYECSYEYDKDENGSFELFEVIKADIDGDGQISSDEEIEKYRMFTTKDKYGEIIKEEMFNIDPFTGEEIQEEGYIYDLEYDEDGLLLKVTTSYFTEFVDNGSYVYLDRVIYSDYTNNTTSGIINNSNKDAVVSLNGTHIDISNARGAHYSICDINGKSVAHGVVRNDNVSVDGLSNGMYIVKISGKNINNTIKLIKK